MSEMKDFVYQTARTLPVTQIKEGEVSDGNTSTQDDLTPELPTLN